MSKQNWQWPEKFNVINWAGMGVESTKSWAELLTADTGMQIRIAPEFDTVNRFRWLGSGLFDSTAGNNSETSQMLMADLKYAVRDGGPIQVRAVWSHSKNNAGFFTRGDSDIKKPQDIKPGTRITDILPYVASTRVVDGLLAWAQVKHEDIAWVPVQNSVENYQAVTEGRADLGFSFPVSPTMREAEKNPHGLDWIELNAAADPEGARRFQEADPLISFGVIPEGGVASAAGKWGTEGVILELTHERTDPELVYHLAEWFENNHDRYKDRHPDNRFRTPEVLMEGLKHTFIPCHEGLIAYLKDKGRWTKAHEVRQEENLGMVDRYCQTFAAAVAAADEKLVYVNPQNQDWLDFWEDFKREQGIAPIKLFTDL